MARRTHFLADTPATEDAFTQFEETGSHQRIAQAIATLITSPEDPGGKVIGIEGEWGSGKTTLIELVKSKIQSNNHVVLFPFDAWAHEGDPLRRTLLETLTNYLIEAQWINFEDWRDKLEILAKRKKTSKTIASQSATSLGRWLAIAVLLIPIGAALLTPSVEKGITWFDSSKPLSWEFTAGVILSFAWVVVLLIHLLRSFQSSDATSSKWTLLQNETITTTSQETTETPDPTSIEFAKYFRQLLGEALLKDSQRKLVIVLDNLDRIAREDTLAIWSTLRTFLEDPELKTQNWFTSLWIIIPFDPQRMIHIWSTQNNFRTDEEPATNENFSESFLNKNIQIRFYLPPPVLSNWQSYLKKLINQAFPEHDNQEKEDIFRAYAYSRHNEHNPRALKLLLNRTTALYRQWGDRYPTPHLAYYALLLGRESNIREELTTGELSDQFIAGILPQNLYQNLAGLLFNTEPEVGLQMLLEIPIQKTLNDSNSDQLVQLSLNVPVGFWPAFSRYIASHLPNWHPLFIAKTALCLENSQLLNSPFENTCIKDICQTFRVALNRWKGIDTLVPFNNEIAKGVAAWCRILNDPESSEKILSIVYHTLEKAKESDFDDMFPSKNQNAYFSPLNIIINNLKNLKHESSIKNSFKIKITAETWVDYCSHVQEHQESAFILNHLSIQIIGTSLSEYLTGFFINEHFISTIIICVEATEKSASSMDWSYLSTFCTRELSSIAIDEGEKAVSILRLLIKLRNLNDKEAIEGLKFLAIYGYFMRYLSFSPAITRQEELSAQCIINHLREDPLGNLSALGAIDFDDPSLLKFNAKKYTKKLKIEVPSSEDIRIFKDFLMLKNESLARQIVHELNEGNDLLLLFKVIASRNRYDPLIVACLRQALDRDNQEAELFDEIIKTNDNKEISLALTFKKLIRLACSKTNFLHQIQHSVDGFQIVHVDLYRAILKETNDTKFSNWFERANSSFFKAAMGIDISSLNR